MSSIAQNLFQQISPLIQYSEEDWQVLKSEADTIVQWGPEMVNVFYETLYAHGSTKAVFREGERPHLEKTLADWFLGVVNRTDSTGVWDHQFYIGLLHVKRGVKNLYLLGMMNRLQQVFLKNSFAAFPPEKAERLYLAFHRIGGTIAALIAESYGEVVEQSLLEALKKVGLNQALVANIRTKQVDAMLAEAKGNR